MSEALNTAHEEAAKQSTEPIVDLDGDKAISDELAKTAPKDDIFADFSDKVPEKTIDDSRVQEVVIKPDLMGDINGAQRIAKEEGAEAAVEFTKKQTEGYKDAA